MLKATRLSRRWLKSATLRFGLKSRKIYEILPRGIRSVLFVCKGNICRSPFAALYLDAKLKERNCPIEVSSAGLETSTGSKANPIASAVALQAHAEATVVGRVPFLLLLNKVDLEQHWRVDPEELARLRAAKNCNHLCDRLCARMAAR